MIIKKLFDDRLWRGHWQLERPANRGTKYGKPTCIDVLIIRSYGTVHDTPSGLSKAREYEQSKEQDQETTTEPKKIILSQNNRYGSKCICGKVWIPEVWRYIKVEWNACHLILAMNAKRDLVGRSRPSRNQTPVKVIISMWLRVRMSAKDNLQHTEDGNRNGTEVPNHREEHEPRRSNDQHNYPDKADWKVFDDDI